MTLPMVLPAAFDTVQDDGHGLGGLGAVIVIGMIVASIGLFFLMRRSLGRVNFVEQPDPRDRAPEPPKVTSTED